MSKLHIAFYDSRGATGKEHDFTVEETDLRRFLSSLDENSVWVFFKNLEKGQTVKFRASSIAYIKY